MNIWILISAIILVIISLIIYKYRNRIGSIKFRNIFLTAIIVTLLISYSWIYTLLDTYPRLNLIDLLTGLILGIISGFFIASYTISRGKGN